MHADQARARVRALYARLRADGAFSSQVLRTAVATSAGYEAGTVTGSTYPIFAALAAMLVVQVTVYETLTRSIQRIAGVILGVLLAYAVADELGLHWWTVGGIVALSISAGRALRLGDGGAPQVPVSGLLVLIASVSGSYASARVEETILGAAVGIAINLLFAPAPRTRDAGAAVQEVATACAQVLTEAAEGLRSTWPKGADRWLTDARAISAKVRASRAAVDKAVTSLRLNPRGVRLVPAAQRRARAQRTLEHVAVQIRGIARTLADDASDPTVGTTTALREALADALDGAAAALREYAVLARTPQLGEGSPEAQQLRDTLVRAREAVRNAVLAATHGPAWDEGHWLVHGSVLTDLTRLLGELDGRAQQDLLDAVLLPGARAWQPPRRSRRARGRSPLGLD